jgi:hypothetical protein
MGISLLRKTKKKFDGPYFYEVPDGKELVLPTFETVRPGIRGHKGQYDKIFRRQRYASVLALTILREGENGPQVLAGPRNPKTNKTHPNVVSVPTKRINPRTLKMAALACELQYETPTEHVFTPKWASYEHPDDMDRDFTLGRLVADAVATKVGYDEVMFRQTSALKLNMQSLTLGQSFVDYDSKSNMQTKEAIGMLNAAMIVPPGTEAPNPAAYSMLKWFDIDAFQQGYHNKDAMGMFPEMGLDAIEMCVHGVCMLTTSRALDRGINMV